MRKQFLPGNQSFPPPHLFPLQGQFQLHCVLLCPLLSIWVFSWLLLGAKIFLHSADKVGVPQRGRGGSCRAKTFPIRIQTVLSLIHTFKQSFSPFFFSFFHFRGDQRTQKRCSHSAALLLFTCEAYNTLDDLLSDKTWSNMLKLRIRIYTPQKQSDAHVWCT